LRGGDDVSPTVCNTNFVDTSMGVEHVFLWRVEAKVVSVLADRTTMEVHWARSHAGSQPELERDEVRTITLGPADSHVLDYVENQAGPSSSCASLLVRISAQPIPQQTQRSVAVDVWTVDEQAGGETRSIHQRIEGPSGESLAYHLPPLEFVPGGVGGAVRQPITMDLRGTFQVTVADDRFLNVGLSAARRLSYGKGEIRGEGHVQFRTTVGETAAILLPEPGGAFAPTPPGSSAVDLQRLFSGRRTWLYVKVESVR